MSTAEVAPVPGTGLLADGAARSGVVRPWLRLLRSELGLIFRRKRNMLPLAVLVGIPALLGIALRVSVPRGGGGGDGLGAAFPFQVAGNGVSGAHHHADARAAAGRGGRLAGREASTGTLRYLRAVPVGPGC